MLAIDSLAFERDDRLLFSDLNAELNPGEIMQVAGANGVGKTTLLRIVTRSLSPRSGEVRWCGTPVAKCAADYAAQLLYLGHHPGVKAALTPAENLRWLSQLHPTRTDISLDTALQRVGLSGYEDVPCYSLSAGQQRRVALARLHRSAAPLWVLDEPFAAIDQAGVMELEALLQSHARRGGAVMLTTHQPLNIPGVRTLELVPQ